MSVYQYVGDGVLRAQIYERSLDFGYARAGDALFDLAKALLCCFASPAKIPAAATAS